MDFKSIKSAMKFQTFRLLTHWKFNMNILSAYLTLVLISIQLKTWSIMIYIFHIMLFW